MRLINLSKKFLLITTIVISSMFVGLPAQAGMVTTAEITGSLNAGLSLADITEQRRWIQQQLESGGVSTADAASRVASLSDSQVQQVHQRIDENPAGAGAAGAILFIFLVLVITDLTGLTDVFPFIRPANQ